MRWLADEQPADLLPWALDRLRAMVREWEELQRIPLGGLGMEWIGGQTVGDRMAWLAGELPRWQEAVVAEERARLTLHCPTCAAELRAVDHCDHCCGEQTMVGDCVLPAGHRGPHHGPRVASPMGPMGRVR